LINFNKKEKSLFESHAHSDTNNKQQQFPDKIYSQKATSQCREKKAISTVKSQQQMTYRQQGKQIILTDRGTNQQTLSTSSQQTRKENLKQ